MDPVSVVAATSAALEAGAYLNAKWSVGIDLRNLQHDRAWGKRLGAFIAALGDTVTLYHMFARVDHHVEGLWFEGKTWTYGELKKGELRPENYERGDVDMFRCRWTCCFLGSGRGEERGVCCGLHDEFAGDVYHHLGSVEAEHCRRTG
jgi:hypothetical protein